MNGDGNGEVRELRLALVCYGGVSLAVYMHGMTKEMLKLVRASRAYDSDSSVNPFAENATEHAYFQALDALAAAGTPVRVVIDVISGTSAGGINGVCLATALANNGDDSELRKTWFVKGDIGGLLNAPRIGPLQVRLATVAMRLLAGIRSGYAPLRGAEMSKWLFAALTEIAKPFEAAGTGGAALVPGDSSLHLRVTTTDLHGYDRLVAMGTGDRAIRDRNFRHVFEFDHQPARPGRTARSSFETDDDVAALALACRATSSIPGAFPPVILRDFVGQLEELDKPAATVAYILERYFPAYTNAAVSAEDTAFIDGGVLDNAPFDLALDMISEQRAQTEVVRHLVYLEPDPTVDPKQVAIATADKPEKAATAPPGWLQTAWTAAATIQRHEPLLQQLLELRRLNERIAKIGQIADQQRESVQRIVDASGAPSDRLLELTYEQLGTLGTTLHEVAAKRAELTYPTYVRLKLQDSIARMTTEIARAHRYHPESGQAAFVRLALGVWLRDHAAFKEPESTDAATLLGGFDLGYRERRLRFVLQGVSALYPRTKAGAATAPPRASIDALKGELWDRLESINDAGPLAMAEVRQEAAELFGPDVLTADVWSGDPVVWTADRKAAVTSLVTNYGAALTAPIAETNTKLWERFEALTSDPGWSNDARQAIAVRYVAFPIWDQLLFPIVAMSATPQFSPIRVTRFSPDRATLLESRDVPGKLRGTAVHHFAAFFHRSWRENDYLWGRLDAAELIMKLLNGLDDAQPRFDNARAATALQAVLSSEADLVSTKDLRADLQAQVKALLATTSSP